MSSSQTVVRAAVRSFRRDGREILSDVELVIQRGEHWALIGPNGSGKTSLLRILSGYEWPSEGSVEVLGALFGEVDLRELRKRIGVVTSALLPKIPGSAGALDVALSGLEASLGLWRPFTEEERAKALAALGAIGVGHLASVRYEVLSQGERQRVLIARALVNAPALLILDEACGGLDPVSRESFLEDLSALATRPDAPTMLFVTHHVEEIPPFLGHALLLSAGRVVKSGAIEEVFTNEHFTRAFGAKCEVGREGERFRLRVGG
jgi:iron complex transport system ATP-binding protein